MEEKTQKKLQIIKNLPKTDFVLGVDPGIKGGYAVFDCNRKNFKCVGSIPLVLSQTVASGRKTYDVAVLREQIAEIVNEQCHNCTFTFCIERQQAMPKQGVVSMFTTGFGYGVWHGIFAGFEPPFPKTHNLVVVKASSWQQILVGEEALDTTKAKSIARIRRLFPDVNLCPEKKRVPSDGLADACNIAHYAFLKMRDV